MLPANHCPQCGGYTISDIDWGTFCAPGGCGWTEFPDEQLALMQEEQRRTRIGFAMNNPSRGIIRSPMRTVKLPDSALWINRMAIAGSTGNRYVIARRRGTKKWGCSCPGWVFKRPGKPRGCKHLTIMLPYLKQLASGKASRPQLRGR